MSDVSGNSRLSNFQDDRPNSLPPQPTPLIGREREITDVYALLRRQDVRLVTLTGPGGTGKTRLAIAVAEGLRDTFPCVHYVDLAPIVDPDLVLSTIAQALGVSESGSQPLRARLVVSLCEQCLLLVLDNFEQVLDAAPLVAELLIKCSTLKIVVTSRAPLRVRYEREFPVPPLPAPDPRRLPELEVLSQYEAVRLFIERAKSVMPTFQVTNDNAPAVAEICARLDGLPLAIELAAARTRVLSPEAMLQRLNRRLSLLTTGARDVPARQQTLRGTIDWSYELLGPGEQVLFAGLAVFAGGRTLEAIEAVCHAEGDLPIDPLDGVESLVDKNLLRQESGVGGERRFVMLETIHEYARERLVASGEAEALRRQHADYFLALAERAEPKLLGPRQTVWLERLEQEHDNFRAALAWSLEQHDVERALRFAAALWRFWLIRGHLSEGRRWFDKLLKSAEYLQGVPVGVRAKAFEGAGGLAYYQGDYAYALTCVEEALSLSRAAGDKLGVSRHLDHVATALYCLGDYARARLLEEEGLALARELGDQQLLASALGNIGLTTLLDNSSKGIQQLGESLALFRELGDTQGVVFALNNLGWAWLEQGDAPRARMFLDESMRMLQGLGDKFLAGECLTFLAGVATAQGRHDAAVRAARLFGAADGVLDSIGAVIDPVDRLRNERYVAAARAHLDEATWARAYSEGRAMSFEQAMAYALEPEREPARAGNTAQPSVRQADQPASTSEPPTGLTERELDVLRLLAQGLSDKEIAEKLIISPRTVNTHLRTIYGKIGVNSRTAAARWASEQHIL